MKIKGIIVLTVILAILVGSCAKNAIQSSKIKTNMDSLSYAIGVLSYSGLAADSINIDPILMAKAMLDIKGEKPEMTEEDARNVYMTFMAARRAAEESKQAEANKLLYKDYIDQNIAVLEQNKTREGVKVTESGIQYEVIKMGTGDKPTTESTVKVHYIGTLIDGKVFDSSVARNEPATFPLAQVIPGWTEALQLMPVGSKFKIWLPSELAYGANGIGEDIKPFSTLIFEVELLEIVK